MRRVLIAGLIVLALVMTSACCWGAKAAQPAKIRVLFEVGGPVHDNEELYPIMIKFLEGTGQFTVNLTRDRDQFLAKNIRNYDMVLIYTTSGNLSKEQEEGLVGFVQNGGAVVGIHSATDSFHNSDAYWKMMGGSFTGHGSGEFTVKITGKSHVIVQGMKPFTLSDETYRHKWHPDSKVVVLMRRDTDSEPVSWVHYFGKGRVFVTGAGHTKSTWESPDFQNMIYRASLWATKRLNP